MRRSTAPFWLDCAVPDLTCGIELAISLRRDQPLVGAGTISPPLAERHRVLGTSAYILPSMRILKVRRVGNSNVVSIPREYEAKGYAPGSSVLLDELPDGELRLLPTDRVREQIRRVGRRVVDERREALQILAEHDPDAKTPKR